MRIEPGVGVQELGERGDHQPGAGQQHERHCEFADDQDLAQASAAASTAGAIAAFLERFVDAKAHGVQTPGASPNSTPVNSETSKVNKNAQRSRCTSTARGKSTGASARSQSTPATATTRPKAPPASAISKLSVSSWRTMRPLDAPSATRTAISRAASAAAREQKVGYIGACDQQHESDGAEQEQQERTDVGAEHALIRLKGKGDAAAGVARVSAAKILSHDSSFAHRVGRE